MFVLCVAAMLSAFATVVAAGVVMLWFMWETYRDADR